MKEKKCQRCKACESAGAKHVVKFDCVEHTLCEKCWNTFNNWFSQARKRGSGKDCSSRVA